MIFAVWLLGALLLLGLVLVVVGWRGREVNDHPCCRGCGFDLVGVFPGNDRCPECGGNLAADSVRVGQRHRRRGLTYTGAGLTAVIVFVLSGLGMLAASGVNLYAYTPTTVLLWQAGSGGSSSSAAALSELHSRYSDSSLDKAHLAALVETGLRLQADSSRTWNRSWSDLLEALIVAGELSQTQVERYIDRAVVFTPIIQHQVREGDEIQLGFKIEPGRCSDGGIGITQGLAGVQIDRVETGIQRVQGLDRFMYNQVSASGWSTSSLKERLPIGIGTYEVGATWRVWVRIGNQRICELDIAGTETVQVVDSETPLIEWVRDDAMARRLQDAISVEECRAFLSRSGAGHLTITIRFPDLPVALAGDLNLVVGKESIFLQRIACEAHEGERSLLVFAAIQSIDGESGTLVLTASEQAATESDIVRALGTELRVRVTIDRVQE